MKKIIIAMFAVAIAAIANAASCTWSTTAMTADMTGILDGGTYWLVALGEDSGASADFIVKNTGGYDFGSYTVVSTGTITAGSAGGSIDNLTSANNGDYYALVVWDGDAEGYFGVAEGVIAGISDEPPVDADFIGFDNSGLGFGITLANTEVVPEPTSGLLMLLGLAGLALKRKKA